MAQWLENCLIMAQWLENCLTDWKILKLTLSSIYILDKKFYYFIMIFLFFSMARLFDVCRTQWASIWFLIFPSPYWAESLHNFIFASLWRSSTWSFLVSLIPLDNCMGLIVVYEPDNMVGPVELQFSVLCNHILHSSPELPHFRCTHATIFTAWLFDIISCCSFIKKKY